MRFLFSLFIILGFASCVEKNRPKENTDRSGKQKRPAYSGSFGFDTSYELSITHKPYLVTGYFNDDEILDTAVMVRHKSSGKDVLFIKHGKTEETFLLKNGKDLEQNFNDFNWVAQFSVVKKGTKIWDNVIDGEIVGEDQIPEHKKIVLAGDGIFLHVGEASGGGVIYFKEHKYHWVQQD